MLIVCSDKLDQAVQMVYKDKLDQSSADDL